MSAVEAIKNSLLLGFDIALIRAKHCVKNIKKCVNNSVANGKKTREELKQLAEKCNKTDYNIIIVSCSEFRDGFFTVQKSCSK